MADVVQFPSAAAIPSARDAVMASFKQAETAGDWGLTDSWYYKTPMYCDDLPDPAPNDIASRAAVTASSHAPGTEPESVINGCRANELRYMTGSRDVAITEMRIYRPKGE